MSVAVALGGPRPWPRGLAPRVLLVVLTLAIAGNTIFFTLFGSPGIQPSGSAVAVIPLVVAAVILSLRHSLAIAEDRRPREALWTVLALAGMAYIPSVWFGWNWENLQIIALASVPVVLSPRKAAILVCAVSVSTAVFLAVTDRLAGASVGVVTFDLYYVVGSTLGPAAALYGTARLVRLLGELETTRADLATTVVQRERLRISRDLHDLLGQSLSAISLKGDLAKRLLRRDPPAARVEIESVALLARDTLRGVQAVSHDEHAVSLRRESDGAAAVLAATGIDCHMRIDLDQLPPAVEGVLAWALREGVANVLRHSQAHLCSISGGRRGGTLFLEVVNDGAPDGVGDGTGLSGLQSRAQSLSGSLEVQHSGGWFRLLVTLPEMAA